MNEKAEIQVVIHDHPHAGFTGRRFLTPHIAQGEEHIKVADLIARNAIIDHYRTRKETVELPETLPAEPAANDGEIEELKASFRRMIYSLPEPYREAVVLTELDGLTQRELADRLGISVSGAKSRVQRGRAQLKQMLDECCTFEFDRRGKVIGCEPRSNAGCEECA